MSIKKNGGTVNNDLFAELDGSLDTAMDNQIAPASYTAAIKGFALDYSRRKGKKTINIDDLLEVTYSHHIICDFSSTLWNIT